MKKLTPKQKNNHVRKSNSIARHVALNLLYQPPTLTIAALSHQPFRLTNFTFTSLVLPGAIALRLKSKHSVPLV